MPPKVRVAACSTGCGARSRRPVGRPPYVPLFGLCVGRGDPTPPKVYVVTRSTDGHRVCAIGCRGRRPRRPAGAWQTGVHGQPPGRADVYRVGCRGGIYPSRDACGSGNICGASRTPPPTTGSLSREWAIPQGRGGLWAGRPTCRFLGCAYVWPPVQRMAAESAPSVVGGGVPDAPRVHGKRAFTGSHRAGHARPLPRGFGRRLTPSPPQFPRPSGSCGPAAAPRCLRAGASPSTPDPAIGRTCTRCASPLPSF